MAKIKVVVLASGSGSNFQALLDACNDPKYPAKIITLITNVYDCYARKRTRGNGINDICIPSKYWKDRETWERMILSTIQHDDPDVVCLAGFMKILSPAFFKAWTNPVLNIHPSLLPAFKGLHAQKQAFDAGVKETGCTVHYVDETLDGGEIIGQRKVRVAKRDTLESLTSKILRQEHKLYPAMLKKIAKEILKK